MFENSQESLEMEMEAKGEAALPVARTARAFTQNYCDSLEHVRLTGGGHADTFASTYD